MNYDRDLNLGILGVVKCCCSDAKLLVEFACAGKSTQPVGQLGPPKRKHVETRTVTVRGRMQQSSEALMTVGVATPSGICFSFIYEQLHLFTLMKRRV